MTYYTQWSDKTLEQRFRELYSAKGKCILPSTEKLVEQTLKAFSREIEIRASRKQLRASGISSVDRVVPSPIEARRNGC